jgi:diguanylate cyclase (GGDEF)-like protein
VDEVRGSDVRGVVDADDATAPVRSLSITVSSSGDARLVSVSGELERATMLEFIEACTGRLDGPLVIDLGGLTFMDGGGYSSLVVIREIAQAGERTVTIRNARGQPARLIDLIADLEDAQPGAAQPTGARPAGPADAVVDEEAERRYSDLLAEFAQTMVTDFPIQAILDHLVERIVEVLPVDAAGVTLISPGHDPHYVTASDEAALEYERLQGELGEGPCTVAYARGCAISVPDLVDDDQFPAFAASARAKGLAAAFAFPLRYEDRLLGALDLYRASPGELGARQLDVAQTFANVAAAYLVNAEARADLVASTQHANHVALHDPLTGLPNRALLFERLVHAMHRTQRTGSLVAIMYIDLDTFKEVNDTLGHRIGDEVLTLVAQRLTALLRPGDTVARLGGDEFAVLCDAIADVTVLDPIAERVNDAFRQPFEVSTGPVEVRASIGIGIGDRTSTSPDRILEIADTAMYEAKRAGGGCRTLFEIDREPTDPSGR